ncbi:MAG TPA: hypothetical protein VEP49_17575 [Acidimicrobiia bacterium]|nr:hypothetical protein [Acidimicrobiia bacterium]
MDDELRWERYGALGGIVFVVLVVVSIFVPGSTPMASDSPAKILKYFHDHQDAIKVASFVGVLASVPILLWAGSLWARLHRAGDRQFRLGLIAVLGLLLGGAGNLTQTATTAAVALELKNVGPTEAKFFFVLGQGFSSAGAIGLAVLVLATSMAVFRFQAFPKWVGWIGVLDGVLFLIASYSIATTGDAIGAFGFASFIVWAIWLLITSVIMFRAKDVAMGGAQEPVIQAEPARS